MGLTQEVKCEGTEDCTCDGCELARQDFASWCDGFNERWQARKQAREQALTDYSGIVMEAVK